MTQSNHSYRITPLEERHAREILQWRYQAPYDFYDPPGDGRDQYYVSQFLNPELNFHAVIHDQHGFVGFCSFGLDGQVPGGNYQKDALDIGLGMKPELTGQGLGYHFFDAILDFAITQLCPETLRLTVASFNQRALNLYRKTGFEVVEEFLDGLEGVPYSIMTRQAVV